MTDDGIVPCPLREGPGLEPPGAAWPSLVRRRVDGSATAARSALGLDTSAPVVMSGHQAQVWHAGILAKRLALDALARRIGATAAWLVADQDTNHPGALAAPARGAGGRWARVDVTMPGAVRTPAETPSGSAPRVMRAVDAPALLSETIEALAAHGGDCAATQVAGANEALARARLGLGPAAMVRALGLGAVPAFAAWARAMAEDAAACADAYNAAVEATPAARLKPLVCRPEAGRVELPLWRVRSGEPRRPVYASQALDIDPSELAPRAVALTVFARWLLCDLFIHGTGGAVYDSAGERWADAWMGAGLAPRVVATATLRLDLGVAMVTDEDVARARWRAHAARHDPALLDDAAASAAKRAHLERIAAERRAGHDPAAAFGAMHRDLGAFRARRDEALRALDVDADRLAAARLDAAVAMDRTWPWVLHPDAALLALKDDIEAALGPVEPGAAR